MLQFYIKLTLFNIIKIYILKYIYREHIREEICFIRKKKIKLHFLKKNISYSSQNILRIYWKIIQYGNGILSLECLCMIAMLSLLEDLWRGEKCTKTKNETTELESIYAAWCRSFGIFSWLINACVNPRRSGSLASPSAQSSFKQCKRL